MMRSSFMLKFLLKAALIVFAAGSAAVAQTPSLWGIDGNLIDAGGPAIKRTVFGKGFVSGAVVLWDATSLATTFVSSGQLELAIPGNLTALSGKHFIAVKNPAGAASNAIEMLIQPVLLAVGPPLRAGAQSATVTATGIGFVPSDYLLLSAGFKKWGLRTTFVNSTSLTGVVPAEALAASAQALVSVLDGNGPFSREEPLTIGTPPIVNSLAPEGAVVDGPGLTLAVTGTGFAPGAAAQWNASRIPTVFVNSTRLLATIDALLLRRGGIVPGNVPISAVNPDGGASNVLYFTVREATPTISKLDPPGAFAGGPPFTLTVTGTGYYSRSKVTFDGVELAAQFISATQLTAAVPSSLIAAAKQAAVSVANGATFMSAGMVSGNFGFPVKPPAFDSMAPASVKAGAAAFTLTANGAGFFPGHSICWNGFPLTTRYLSPAQLSAVVDAGRVAEPGPAAITVVSAGGAVSNRIEFRIEALPPVISSLSPASVAAGSAAFMLTVRGTNLVNGAVVQWNGTVLPTSFAGPAELTATVAANLVARAAAAMISVSTPGGLSNPFPFAVTAALPAVDTGGVVNAFSGRPVIAPGGLVTIYGTNLAARAAAAEGYPLPMALGGTSLTIDGRAAPLLYASPNQVNLQTPFELTPGAGALVIIDVNGARSAAIPITVAEIAPGTLRVPQSNHALAVNYPSGTLNSAETPARPGDYIIAYMTGQGRLDNLIAAGEAVPDTPLFVPVARVEAKIGGRPAGIGFAGLAPGYAGLMQVNLKVPDVGPGEQIFEVSIGDFFSNATVLSVGESEVP